MTLLELDSLLTGRDGMVEIGLPLGQAKVGRLEGFLGARVSGCVDSVIPAVLTSAPDGMMVSRGVSMGCGSPMF